MRDTMPILLAEDNVNDAELIIEALTNGGLANRTIRVRDGVEALDYLRSEGAFASRPPGHPAVVVLDIKMPRMGGIEALREIRTDPALRLLPVVMLTSSREEHDVVRSYELGTNAYIVKPVRFADFAAAVVKIGDFFVRLNELPPTHGARP